MEPKPLYVIATDLSLSSRRAAAIATRLAARTHARCELYCAVPLATSERVDFDIDRARAAVEAIARRHGDVETGASARLEVVRDVPIAIARHAERSRAALLVLAPHGVTNWKRVLLGGVTERVLRLATTSVLIAREEGASRLRRVVVGVDRAPGIGAEADARNSAALTTVRHAIGLARALGAELVVVHVSPPDPVLMPLVGAGVGRSPRRSRGSVRDLARWIRTVPHRGVRVAVRELVGSPAESIVGEARRSRAGMIVVGASGKSSAKQFLLGNVAYAVAAASQVSVLIVRDRGGKR